MQYIAIVNVPGYLPMDDDPPTFDTAVGAWAYLAQTRREHEEAVADALSSHDPRVVCCMRDAADCDCRSPYSAVVAELERMVGLGTVYGDSPGADSEYDLGLAYTVDIVEDGEVDG